ncbi:MAG TPA: hypothetical protein IAB45_01555 [Candidatus Onthousia faecavium]|nr:hypothetical protein [Candidatus Onthousia faecavium]
MGRYLSCAIATSIKVGKKDNKPFEKGELDKLKYSIKRLFDYDLYNVEENEDFISLEIKKDVFDNNIHELCVELNNSLYQSSFLLYEDDYLNKPKEEWPITLIETKDDEEEKKYNNEKYMVKLSENSYDNDPVCRDLSWFGFSPLLRRDIKEWSDYFFDIEGIDLFLNISKVSSEDETELICLLNWFKRDYFKNKLNGSLIFRITE